MTTSTSMQELIARYDALLFDAYGVLVHAGGAMPGARELVQRLERDDKPYYIVSNDASRLPRTTAARYRRFGLPISEERIITSGLLLPAYFAQHRLQGARCAVLGTKDSETYARQAGAEVVSADTDFDVLVVADESGFPFLDVVDTALTSLFRMFDAGRRVHLVLPNPDLVYSAGIHEFGIAAGSVALILESALQRRYRGRSELQFVALGKPHAPLFEEGLKRCATRNVAMIGDQLETDIQGANACGIDTVLIATGVSALNAGSLPPALRPKWRVASLSPQADRL